MTTFDEREKAFENRFAHEQERVFKAEARRMRRIGLWAAGLLSQSPADAELYAEMLLALSVAEGVEAVVAKLGRDFAAGGVAISQHQIYREMNYELSRAIEQLMIE